MSKKSPQEKEKILRRLSEKEIQAQLYGYQTSEPAAVTSEIQIKEEPAKQQPAQLQVADRPKNPYLIWQIVLLMFFLILIWISARQIIKVVVHTCEMNVSSKNNAARNTPKPRILQPKFKGAAKK